MEDHTGTLRKHSPTRCASGQMRPRSSARSGRRSSIRRLWIQHEPMHLRLVARRLEPAQLRHTGHARMLATDRQQDEKATPKASPFQPRNAPRIIQSARAAHSPQRTPHDERPATGEAITDQGFNSIHARHSPAPPCSARAVARRMVTHQLGLAQSRDCAHLVRKAGQSDISAGV